MFATGITGITAKSKYFVYLPFFIFVSLYFVLWSNKSSLEFIKDSNFKNGLFQLTDQTHEWCDPTYFMWDGRTYFGASFKQIFSENGFDIDCDPYEISISDEWNEFFQYAQYAHNDRNHSYICQKYNNNNTYNNKKFCEGGRVLYLGQKMWGDRNELMSLATKYQINIFTKDNLNKVLTKYCNNETKCNFKLLSYNMDDEQQRIEFLTQHINCTNTTAQYDKTWVFKESKHQGSGVHFYNNHQLIYRLVAPNKTEENMYYKNCNLQPLRKRKYFKNEGFTFIPIETENGRGYKVDNHRLIMQEFISSPLLFENRAFHLRVFGLIASWSNPFIALLHPRSGIFYRNPLPFDNKRLNKDVLRTNGHVSDRIDRKQKRKKIYDFSFKKRWGYHRAQRYLNEIYGDAMINYTTNKLPNDITNIAKQIFKANFYYYPDYNVTQQNNIELFHNNIDLPFHIFCMDIAINDKFELKLLEVNNYCGVCCPGIKGCVMDNDGYDWVCDGFVKESADIILEIYNSKYSHSLQYKTIHSLNKFEIVSWV